MLQDTLLAFAREGGFASGEKYVAGVSGGIDSVSLLHALVAVAPDLGITLHVAHVDHGLRGEEGVADSAFVARLAAEWGLPATVAKTDARGKGRALRLGEEAAARLSRYECFADIVQATGAAGVIVGHTADDQVETVLLHFLRGSGAKGLAGMPAVQTFAVAATGGTRVLRVIRPLLQVSRAEVAAYAAQFGLAHREDRSNRDRRYLRNRVRHELLPLLETYNPNLRAALLRLAGLAEEDYRFLEGAARDAWGKVATVEGGVVALSLAGLRALPLALQRLVIREAFASVAGGVQDLEAGHVEDVLALAGGRTGAALDLPGGVTVRSTYGRLEVGRDFPAAPPLPAEGVRLDIPGRTSVGEDWVVDAEVGAKDAGDAGNGLTAVLDLDKSGTNLHVRRRRPGDRLRPVGLSGSKKLQDIMVDRKIPRQERDAVPVVVSPTGVLLAAGLALDEGVCPGEGTRNYLRLRFHKRGST